MRFSDKLSRLRPMSSAAGGGKGRPAHRGPGASIDNALGTPSASSDTRGHLAESGDLGVVGVDAGGLDSGGVDTGPLPSDSIASESLTTEPTVFEVTTAGAAESSRSARMRQLLGGVAARQRRRHRPEVSGPQELPVGRVLQSAAGPYHCTRLSLSVDHRHGRAPVADALRVSGPLLQVLALDPLFEGVDLSKMLMLDTETTGLSGGAGTVPFLIGLSFFERGRLQVEQLFLRNLGEEAPMLHVLAERIAQASCVVSYNGKSFDWPLLRSRFILNRVQAPSLPPHLDLLHCARRLWKGRMDAVRLMDVETQLLGFTRQDDVGGAAIPGIYVEYLRGADPVDVVSVLKHNELDVIALPAMLGVMGRHFEQTHGGGTAHDKFAFAKVAARAKDASRARAFAMAAAEGVDTDVAAQALALAADLDRRADDPGGALALWSRARELAPTDQMRAELDCSLAKLCEHQIRDLRRALQFAAGTELAEGPEAHGRRCGRLLRRLLRDEGHP